RGGVGVLGVLQLVRGVGDRGECLDRVPVALGQRDLANLLGVLDAGRGDVEVVGAGEYSVQTISGLVHDRFHEGVHTHFGSGVAFRDQHVVDGLVRVGGGALQSGDVALGDSVLSGTDLDVGIDEHAIVPELFDDVLSFGQTCCFVVVGCGGHR